MPGLGIEEHERSVGEAHEGVISVGSAVSMLSLIAISRPVSGERRSASSVARSPRYGFGVIRALSTPRLMIWWHDGTWHRHGGMSMDSCDANDIRVQAHDNAMDARQEPLPAVARRAVQERKAESD